MMYSYHSIQDLEHCLLENENENKITNRTISPTISDFICYNDTKYIFYIFFLIIIIFFLIFIAIIISHIK